MPKVSITLPVFVDMQPQQVEVATAIWLVKHRADSCLVRTDFGWVKIHKYQMLDFLEALKQPTVTIKKVPHFTTYYFSLA